MESTMLISESVALLIIVSLLVALVTIFIRISIRLRRGGGSLTTVVLGATDEFMTKDRSRAAETVVNENAGEKREEQSTEGAKKH